MPSNVVGNTFRAIELEPQGTAELEFPKFVERCSKNSDV